MSLVKMNTKGYYNSNALEKEFEYCVSKCEWWSGNGIRTDSISRAIFDMRYVKILTGKEGGKQLYHMIVSIWRSSINRKNFTDKDNSQNTFCYLIGNEISIILFNAGYQNAYFKHMDGNNAHLHFIINSVNFGTGKKMSGIGGYAKKIFYHLRNAYPFLKWEGPYFV